MSKARVEQCKGGVIICDLRCCLLCIYVKKTWMIHKKVSKLVTCGEEGNGLVDRRQAEARLLKVQLLYCFDF